MKLDNGMLLTLSGSLSRQQSSLAEDLTDEEFTPEELSLVQHLLPPERFIRVLLALRVTLKGCSESEDFATPVKQLQPDFDLNTSASQISMQSLLIEKSDQHIHTAQSPADGGTYMPRGNHWQVPDSSNDDEVPAPARQFPTAAAEFWSRLQHGADTEADSEADSEADESCEEEQQDKKVLPHVQGSLQHTQSMSSDPAVEPATNRQQRLLTGKPHHVSTRPSQLDHVQGSMLQHVTSGRLLSGGTPRSDGGLGLSKHCRMQHSSAASLQSDNDADDDGDDAEVDGNDSEMDRDDSNKPSAFQLQGKAARGSLARLLNPKTVSSQQQQQHKPLHQTQWAQIPLQRQQQEGSAPQQHWQGTPARRTGSAAASALPQFAEDAARASRQPASHAESFAPSAHPNAVKQPVHLMTQGGGDGADGVEMSPMQSAVSAVVDRLQSVQMGLAGAEDRLALLSGVKLAGTRLPPADIQSRGSSPVLSPAAKGGGQLHALVQSSAGQNWAPQQDPAQSAMAHDEAPQQDPVQSSASRDGSQQHDDAMPSPTPQDRGQQRTGVQSSAAQHGEQQHSSKQSAAGSASRPHAVADIIRRFDSGNAWGGPQPGAHAKRLPSDSPEHPQHEANRPSVDSSDHAQHFPRISALIPRGERQEEHTCNLNNSDSTLTDRGNESLLLPANPDCSPLSGGSSDLQLEGVLRHTSTTQGTELQPQLRGQGSSMRGDLWLPQLWPKEQMQDSASPRNRMHKAMEAVREAERAVEAASVFAPTRSQTSMRH